MCPGYVRLKLPSDLVNNSSHVFSYMRLPNFEEVKEKYDFVARVNEGMNQQIEIIKN